MALPLVSVVIPTYNRADLLRHALESVLAQTYPHFEVAVMDDGSTDHTAELVGRYTDPRLRYHRLPHAGMPAPARNAGIERTRGELVAFLDSDDAWAASKLERQVEVLDRRPEVGLVCTNARLIDEQHVAVGHVHTPENFRLGPDPLARLLRGNYIINSSVVCRRSVLERAGPFSDDPRLRAVEDYDLWLRCAALADIAYLPEPLTDYRRHAGSISTAQSRRHYAESLSLIHARARAQLAARASLRRPLLRALLNARRAEYKAMLGERRWLRAIAPWLHVNLLKLQSGLDRVLMRTADR